MSTDQGPSRRRTVYRRAAHDNPYTQLANAMLRDSRLALDTRGLLAALMSRPSDWMFNVPSIMREQGVGRDKVYRMLRELRARGYCRRKQDHAGNGTWADAVFEFTDDPSAWDRSEPQPENPHAAEPHAAGPHQTKKESVEKQNRSATQRSRSARVARYVTEAALDQVRQVAPGWDRQALLARFLDWNNDNLTHLNSPDAAFVAWAQRFTRGRPPP
ncbi:MAG: hypothetical protein F9K29_09020 [Hyphomicrobiaceae bacterium]|nr:MAG: hypothetical protein F9K29_09020 [Hyphomicrobiaceae bacterium]